MLMGSTLSGFLTTKVLSMVIGAALVVVGVFGAHFYVKSLNKKLENAVGQIQNLTDTVAIQADAINELTANLAKVEAARAQVDEVKAQQQAEVTVVREKFRQNKAGKSRDLGTIAQVKPELIQKAVNRGTVEAYRCIEIASGSALTETELAASKPSEINSQCPSLANPNYVAK